MRKLSSVLCQICVLAAVSAAAMAAEEVGSAVKVNVTVSGAGGALAKGDRVHRDERIRANASGVGQFEFDDGTKLAIGPNSSIVIDKYVLGEGGKLKQLTLKATRGAFRWISGRSSSVAYKITTPAGTLGVRGTAFDFDVTPQGNVMVVQLAGSSQFCAGACKRLTRTCDFLVARRGSGISDPERVSTEALTQFGGARAFPFLRDNSELLSPLRLGRNNCNLSRTAKAPAGKTNDSSKGSPGTPAPSPPSPPSEPPSF